MGLPPKDDPASWQAINPQATQDGASQINKIQPQAGARSTPNRPEVWTDSPRNQYSEPNRTEIQALPQPGSRPAPLSDYGDVPGPHTMDSMNVMPSSSCFGDNEEDPRDKTPLGKFVNSNNFQNFTLFIICLNGIWIGLDVEYNHPLLKKNGSLPLEPVSTIIEHLFCAYFTVEIVFRMVAFRTRNLTDGWFLFDFVLVLFMVIETWILVIIEALTGGGGGGLLSKFSTLRLLRLTRLTRLMTSLPELLTLVRGMLNAARAVGAVLLFMVLLMYIFAIVFTAQLGDPSAPEHKMEPYWVRDADPTGVELFGSMGDSMMSLFTRGLLGDNLAETLQAIKDRGGMAEGDFSCEDPSDVETCERTGGMLWLMWVFILFMIISAFCVLNMLVGILCEVIDGTAKDEMEQNNVLSLKSSIFDSFRAVISTMDTSGDENITKNEWRAMRLNEAVRSSFVGIGVEEEFLDLRLDQMEEHLFGGFDKHKLLDQETRWMPEDRDLDDNQGVPLDEFVGHILDVRPDVPASYLDLEILQMRAEKDERAFNAQCDNIENMIHDRMGRKMDPVDCLRGDDAVVEPMSPMAPEPLSPMAPDASPIGAPPWLQTQELPNNGTSSTADAWIQGLSTQFLFAELRHRAAVQSGSSVPPALYVD